MSNPIVYHQFSPGNYQPGPPVLENVDTDEINLAQHVNLLWQSRWLISAVLFIALLCSALYMISVKPVYEANFLIHVEEDGNKDAKSVFGEMGAMFNVKTSSSAEVELVRSRLVISRALENLNIFVSVEPDYFPVLGRWLAKESMRSHIYPRFGGYARGNETVKVSAFNVPGALLNSEFFIVARENGKFDLKDKAGPIAEGGNVGVPLKINHPKGAIELFVSELRSEPGVRFKLKRSSKLAMIESVQSNLKAAEQGKQSSVIKVSLQGNDPILINALMAEIGKEYIEQNSARKTQEANKALAFLNKQLPDLRRQLEDSETKYNVYRNSKGTIDIGEESRLDLQQLTLAKTKKMELEQKRPELLVRFTPNHPVVIALDTQLRELSNDIRKLDNRIKSLPLMEQELLKLSRDVKINTDLYTSLLNTARQLRLVTASSTSNVRLVDVPMTPERPISAGPVKIFGIGILAGLLAGGAIAFLRASVQKGIESALEIEGMLNLPVYASIPQSKMQKKLEARSSSRLHKKPLLAKNAPLDSAVESLRNFRAMLHFSSSQARKNIVLITSPTAGNGKSFISANLAVLIGSSSKRLLLIDADLMHGDLHQYFGVEQSLGLAEVLGGNVNVDSLIHREVAFNVDFLSSGVSGMQSDLLMQPKLEQLLRSLTAHYDTILLNAAPVLEVADSLALGVHATAIYLVARARVSTARDLAETMRILRQAGLSAKGCLLNGVAPRLNRGSYQYKYNYGNYWQRKRSLRNTEAVDVTTWSRYG